jgi:MFS family permease
LEFFRNEYSSTAQARLIEPEFQATPTPIIQPLAFGSFVARPRNTLASDLSMPCSWAAAMDIASPCPGTVSGAMNMWGNIGGAIAATVNGYLLRWFHGNWNTHG